MSDEVVVDYEGEAMSAFDVDAVLARCEAATEGPWKSGWLDSEQSTYCVVAPAKVEGGWGAILRTTKFERGWRDAEFIAHARTDLPAACERVRELEAALRELRQKGWAVLLGVTLEDKQNLVLALDELRALLGEGNPE